MTSFSVLASQGAAYAQGLGDLQGRADALGANAAMGGMSSMGKLDSQMLTPTIKQDDRAYPSGADAALGVGRTLKAVDPQPLKPLPPNEFQKFVLESTASPCTLWGRVFAQSSGAFAAQSNTPVSADYRLGPGDELQIKRLGFS